MINAFTALFGISGTEWGVFVAFVLLISYNLSTGVAAPSTRKGDKAMHKFGFTCQNCNEQFNVDFEYMLKKSLLSARIAQILFLMMPLNI